MIAIYSLGFCFMHDFSHVALIRKTKPDWQKGKLNGVGGACDDGETLQYTMWREWNEETGRQSCESDWKLAIECRGEDYIIGVFSYRLRPHDTLPAFKSTDEQVAWYMTHSINSREDIVPNIRWMIPLCLDTKIIAPVKVNMK